jgi:hypothetical protein
MLYHDEGSTYWQTNGNVVYNSNCRWLGIWAATEHDISAGNQSANYSDNPQAALVGGSNNVIATPALLPFDAWPQAATDIANQSGLEAAYSSMIAKTKVLNDAEAAIRYSADAQGPQWGSQAFRGLGDWNDDVHYASANGATVRLAFSGSGVDVLGEKNGDQGLVEVFVDNVSQGTFDTSLPATSPRQAQQLIFGIHTLSPGAHTIAVVKRSGQFATIDAFRLDQAVSPVTGS